MNYHPPSMPEDWDTIALGSSCDNVTDTCCSSNDGRTAAEGGPGHQYAVAVAEQYAIDAAGDARTEMSGGQLEYGNQTVALCPTTAATASRAASPLALSPSYPIQQTWQPAPGTYYAPPHVYQPPPPPAYAPQALPPPPPTYAPPPPPQNAPAQLVPADLQLDRAIEDPICGLEGCSIRLDDLTVGGQRRHLRDFHAAALQHGRVQCTWVYDSGTMCGRDLDKNNWGKHIAAVHYGSTAEQCPYCPKVICRPDALRRHVDNFHSRADED
ncbi:hypothetical protein EVJ58_g5430 [Rhodofomes roseus]|uniref:C2H2-type domain-containing protein n=1 Tax=Rhodofomes roseus TaxID=34475 RepID=A0A4Y9YCD1_9APHY|nr:hypothetical protein EVJ58_g5430 [Rhodofomes roseus]